MAHTMTFSNFIPNYKRLKWALSIYILIFNNQMGQYEVKQYLDNNITKTKKEAHDKYLYEHLFNLIIRTNKEPHINDEIENIIKNNSHILTIDCKHSPPLLMVSVRSSNKNSSLETVKLLVKYGDNINFCDKNGCTLLMYAVNHSGGTSDIETVKYLIGMGANVNAKTKCGRTILSFALSPENGISTADTAKLLIEKGAILDENMGFMNSLTLYLQNPPTNPDLDFVKYLLNHGADVNAQNNMERTPLISTIIRNRDGTNNQKIIEFLIDHNANLNVKDNRGYTALMYAVGNQDIINIKLLLKQGADANILNNQRCNALSLVGFSENNEKINEIRKSLMNVTSEIIVGDVHFGSYNITITAENYAECKTKIIADENEILKMEINKLRKENEQLTTHIELQPEGKEYLELLKEWKAKHQFI